MPRRYLLVAALGWIALQLAGCPRGNPDFKMARRAEALQDWDTALVHYERALKSDPLNTEYKLKATRIRFEAGQFHVRNGQKLREKGDLQLALAEFEKALAIDPSSPIAEQEIRKTLELIASSRAAAAGARPPAPAREEPKLLERPPELAPLSRAPINLKMTNEARIVFETIGKLAGLTVVFDPEFPSRRIPVELNNVTLEQALDIVALQSKAFWKPVTSNILIVVADNQQKRRDYEEQIVRTFYLSNTLLAQDLTEIVTGLRQLLDLKRIQQVNSQNAIIVRDTPDKITLAEKLIRDIDKPKPEVVIEVAVLQARRDRMTDLGIAPGTRGTLTFTPRGSTTSASSTTTGGTQQTQPTIPLNRLQHLSSADYSVSLPGATATALLTDSTTKIIQNPEIRVVDGQSAKLRVGDRVPIATGSFQAGVGVGAVGAGGAGIVNPLVNTQFQYTEVGVNVDITPRIHPNRQISLKVMVEVSSVTGRVNIGGIEQPIISQRKIDHDVRLEEGEVNILGGLIDRTETKTVTGWPGFSQIPFFRHFFSGETTDRAENEILIVLIPRVVRLSSVMDANLRSLSAGTETNVQVRRESEAMAPSAAGAPPAVAPPAGAPPAAAQPPSSGPAPQTTQEARLRFEPASVSLGAGETTTIGIVVEGVKDLFSIPILLQYNPAVISVEEVRHGGFLSGGNQEIAIVQRVDKERGQAIISATRQPNTPGVNGTGTLMGIVIRGVASGTSSLTIMQVNARDSQQKPVPLVAGEAQIRVQ